MVCSEKLRRWSSSSIILRRWVTGTPPVTHTYTQTIKQPTLHYLTRSVRRRAATSKRGYRPFELTSPIRHDLPGTSLEVDISRRGQRSLAYPVGLSLPTARTCCPSGSRRFHAPSPATSPDRSPRHP